MLLSLNDWTVALNQKSSYFIRSATKETLYKSHMMVSILRLFIVSFIIFIRPHFPRWSIVSFPFSSAPLNFPCCSKILQLRARCLPMISKSTSLLIPRAIPCQFKKPLKQNMSGL
ncbi:hypothetical protein COOONC_00400 [Cooperia oncophora]